MIFHRCTQSASELVRFAPCTIVESDRSMVATATSACTCSYAARTSHPAHPSDALFACENCCRDVAVNNLQAPASNERLTATPSLRMRTSMMKLRMRLRLRGLSTDGVAADHFTVRRRWRRFKCFLVVVVSLLFFWVLFFTSVLMHSIASAAQAILITLEKFLRARHESRIGFLYMPRLYIRLTCRSL